MTIFYCLTALGAFRLLTNPDSSVDSLKRGKSLIEAKAEYTPTEKQIGIMSEQLHKERVGVYYQIRRIWFISNV
jgi:hypothetical protein